ncbi:extensin family protein [Thioclava sp. FR2]|uniref:extensin-like domain-containing protein n=1 Tax=Thioclava sp. FR2 TaxID=3445780 RepID=UPI003EB81819
MRQVRVWVLAVSAAILTAPAFAEPPKSSPRPLPRPAQSSAIAEPQVVVAPVQPQIAEVTAPQSVAPVSLLRPRARPEIVLATAASVMPVAPAGEPAETASPAAAVPAEVIKAAAVSSPRPMKRPKGLVAKQAAAVRVLPGKEVAVSKKGSVCGIPDIKGQTLSPISAKTKGCGISYPVKVTSVAGVRLKNGATINCETAKALRTWITKAVEPTYGKGNVVELTIAASYACRPRNNKRGAKISEHGRGNAIDISAITFSNGKSATVLRNYDKSMRKVHKAACGTFGTTLGPGSDGFHEDHLHFDVARYRSGSYCR